MDSIEFKEIRGKLAKTQKQMAQILGTSIKAIHSYEQGWRTIPHHVERQLLFILTKLTLRGEHPAVNCWDINQCPDDRRDNCPAWEFHSGDMCWFINGTVCSGKVEKNWQDKIKTCRCCSVFIQSFPNKGRASLKDDSGHSDNDQSGRSSKCENDHSSNGKKGDRS